VTFLYVQDDLELAQRGEDTTLKDAAAEVAARAEDARVKQEAVTEAQAKTATLAQRRAGWHEQLEQVRRDLKSFLEGAMND